MATLPTPEETAIEILRIFVNHFSCRAGNLLGIKSFQAVWHDRGLKADDFKPGMEYAAKQGWVEIQPTGDSFRLTESGFAIA